MLAREYVCNGLRRGPDAPFHWVTVTDDGAAIYQIVYVCMTLDSIGELSGNPLQDLLIGRETFLELFDESFYDSATTYPPAVSAYPPNRSIVEDLQALKRDAYTACDRIMDDLSTFTELGRRVENIVPIVYGTTSADHVSIYATLAEANTFLQKLNSSATRSDDTANKLGVYKWHLNSLRLRYASQFIELLNKRSDDIESMLQGKNTSRGIYITQCKSIP